MTNHRTRGAAAMLLSLIVLALLGSSTFANQPADLHCPDGWFSKAVNNVAGNGYDYSDYVPFAGDVICVKAGPGNTGIVTANGEQTLREILFDAGIVGGRSGKGRDVSYWVMYESGPIPSATPDPSVSPTPDPTIEPTPAPTSSIGTAETMTPAPTEAQEVPNTAMEGPHSPSDDVGIILGWVGLIALFLFAPVSDWLESRKR